MRRQYRTDAKIERAKRINTFQDREYRKSGSKKFFDSLIHGAFDQKETD